MWHKEHQYTFRTASYSRSHSHTAIYYIAICNIQQLYIYITLCVMWHKEHQYIFRTASYSRSHSHTAICYISISNIQQLYIPVSVSCDTKEHQYTRTFRTASYNRSHSHTAVTDWPQPNTVHRDCLQCSNMELEENSTTRSRYTAENSEDLTYLLTDIVNI